jgi:Zn ribbon nucleic-acid-binding protein
MWWVGGDKAVCDLHDRKWLDARRALDILLRTAGDVGPLCRFGGNADIPRILKDLDHADRLFGFLDATKKPKGSTSAARKSRPKPPKCPECSKGKMLAKSSPNKARYRKCDNCGHTKKEAKGVKRSNL